MKKLLMISTVLAFVGSFSIAQISNTPLGLEPNTLSVSPSGGAFIPAVGKYDAALDINDLLETGPTFGVSIKYTLSPMWSLRGTYDFAYNNFESTYRPTGKKPAFVAPMITSDMILNFGSLVTCNDIVKPYCFAGAGIYLWKLSEDGTCGPGKGNAMTSVKGKEWEASSVGVHTGIGAEVYVSPVLALFAEGQYRFMFSKNADDFGSDFGNVGFAKIGGGLTYYFAL